MPPEMPLLLFNRLLKHGREPTISAGLRGSLRNRGIAQSPPSTRGGDEMHLAVERPILPLLPNAITQHHLRDVAVAAIVLAVGPLLEDLHVQDLDVEQLGAVVEPW